jgi:hypothetical protein
MSLSEAVYNQLSFVINRNSTALPLPLVRSGHSVLTVPSIILLLEGGEQLAVQPMLEGYYGGVSFRYCTVLPTRTVRTPGVAMHPWMASSP